MPQPNLPTAGAAPGLASPAVAQSPAEMIQRARMVLDVAAADRAVAEALLGPTHPTADHFRQALADAERAWDRLRAQFGGKAIAAALAELPAAVLRLRVRPNSAGGPVSDLGQSGATEVEVVLIPIAGRTYRVEGIVGTDPAPTQFRLTRLDPPLDHGPYYVCRLQDGSTQCDCAEWHYRAEAPPAADDCKHLAALDALGWL